MRLGKTNVLILTLLGLFAMSTIASAHGSRSHYRSGPRVGVGISIGVPIWYPGPVFHPYRPYYSYPAPVYVDRPVYVERPVYIERDDVTGVAPQAQGQYWYYCRESAGYYPYVPQCAGPWERVPARPPGE